MKNITAIENHRLGTRVNVGFTTDDVPPVQHTRYVDAAAWDTDPQAVIASVFDYLSKMVPQQVTVVTKNVLPVTMSDAQVTAKLAAMAQSPVAKG